MAEHPAEPEHAGGGGGPAGTLTRKVGPLPAWAWAALLLVGYFLYTRMKGSSSSTPAGSSSPGMGADMNPVPAAGENTDSGLGAGYPGGPSTETINNYYGPNPANTGGTGAGTSTTPPPQLPIPYRPPAPTHPIDLPPPGVKSPAGGAVAR